jgi:hypothetical protein
MSQTDQPTPRHRRGGRQQSRSPQQHRPQGSRSSGSGRSGERSQRPPREDHRDWEPVDRGRDIRRRAAEQPGFFQKLLSTLTFGLLGGKKKPAGHKSGSKSTTPKAGDRPARPERERGPRADRPARVPREARQPTPPNPDAVTGPRLHVGNLSYDAAESDLTDLFNGVGKVQHVEVVYHRETQRSKGFAFVQMLTLEEAKRAVTELHGKDYMGRKLEIGPARAPGQGRDQDRRPARREES